MDDQLTKELQVLNERIAKQNSYKHILLAGIVKGVGYAIGASIVAGIVLSIWYKTVDTIDNEVPGVDLNNTLPD